MSVVPAGIHNTPAEILDRILDFLHDDRTALCAASLVSRAWVATPRHHLFGQTVVNEYFIPRRGKEIEENVHGFLALAQSAQPTFLRAIRRLILAVMTPALVKAVIDSLVRANAAPTHIVYVYFNLSTSVPWNASTFQNVHDFTFETACNTVGDDAWEIVASFPGLRTLAVYAHDGATLTMPPDPSVFTFRHIQTLDLQLRASEELLGWFTRLDNSHFPLETLDLRMFRSCHRGWGPVQALNAFLKRVSGTLTHLCLSIVASFGERSLNQGPPVDLSPLVHLSSLVFRTHDLHAVCDALASLPSSCALRALTVHAPPWRFGITEEVKECDCIPAMLLARCAQIMEGTAFMGIGILDLNIESWVHLDTVAEIFAKWKKESVLKLSSTVGNDPQQNSIRSFAHLVYTHRR